MSKTSLVALLAAFSLPVSASLAVADGAHKHAHGKDHEHAQGKKKDHAAEHHGPRHGGLFVEVDGHHGVEMVAGDSTLVFHMSEHHDPLDVTGSSFKAIIQTESGTRVLQLKAEGTTLSAALDGPLPKGAKIAISGKDPHDEIIQARFVIE